MTQALCQQQEGSLWGSLCRECTSQQRRLPQHIATGFKLEHSHEIYAAKNRFFSMGSSLVLYMLREVKAVRATEKGI